MPSVTLGFDPEVDTYDNIRAILDGIYEVPTEEAEETGPASPPDTGEVLPGGWTKQKMRRYLGAVSEERHREALRIIAENAPEVGIPEVQEAMGYAEGDRNRYGGMMTALRNAAKRARGVKDKPYRENYNARTYSIDKRVAALVIEVLDEMAE